MADQSFMRARSRYGWSWLLVLFGVLSWVSIGCSPQTLSMLLMPWSDNKTEPKYKLFPSDKLVHLAIVSTFVDPPRRPELMPADSELAEKVAQFIRKRCEENKHKVKIVPNAQVRSYQLKQIAGGELSALEVGRHFKADYVLELNIGAMRLYAEKHYPRAYQGSADIAVNLYQVEVKEGDHIQFAEGFRTEYPGARPPIDAGSSDPAQFRGLFLMRAARDISKMFIAYPPEEDKKME